VKIGRFLMVVAALAAIAGVWLAYELNRPYKGFTEQAYLAIPRGTSSAKIAGILLSQGVVDSQWKFLAARVLRRGRTLQAGEYMFTKPASVLEVYDHIARGDTYYEVLVVPEGKNIFEIAELLDGIRFLKGDEFLKAARDPKLIRDLDPRAPSLEGYLFPSTYRVDARTTPESLARSMTNEFRRAWKSLNTNADVHETVTLASLVEKEGKVAAERPAIAAVYRNRLRIGMKLDCDPTTIYAALLDGRYRGTIYKSDLLDPHPYNTYRNPGLPPGPIANPGLASLKATLDPADVNYLFFVAKGDGSGAHVFTETYAEHGEAVAEYRRAIGDGLKTR
jgi:UPF0755 protein